MISFITPDGIRTRRETVETRIVQCRKETFQRVGIFCQKRLWKLSNADTFWMCWVLQDCPFQICDFFELTVWRELRLPDNLLIHQCMVFSVPEWALFVVMCFI